MKLDQHSKMLRIYIGEDDKYEDRALHDVIVERAREAGMAGATVFRALGGFGANSRMRSSGMLGLSRDLPIVVVLVDKPERIESFVPTLDNLVQDGLVTIEDIEVVLYRSESMNILEEGTEEKDAEIEQVKEEMKEEIKETIKDEIKEEIVEAVIDAAKEEIEEDF